VESNGSPWGELVASRPGRVLWHMLAMGACMGRPRPPEGEVYSLEDFVHCVWCGRRLVATHAPVAVREHARRMVFCSLQCAEDGTQALGVPGFGNASIR
jgi:hypothetical protein